MKIRMTEREQRSEMYKCAGGEGGGQHEGIKESKTFRSNEMENLKINTEYK